MADKAGKKLATNVLKVPGRTSEITSKIATAAASRIPKAAWTSLSEVNNFDFMGKSLCLGKIV